MGKNKYNHTLSDVGSSGKCDSGHTLSNIGSPGKFDTDHTLSNVGSPGKYDSDREDGKGREISGFVTACIRMGIKLEDRQIQDFLVYYDYLVEQNKVMNLTAITEFDEVVAKHFVDSLSIVKGIDMTKVESLIDVGTGAGFPGIPLKIVFPHLRVLLLDSLNKRVQFLNQVIEKLQYKEITAIHSRAEELAREKEYREQFDLCVSRAVANLSSLSEYCLPFVKMDGMFISYKSAGIEEELTGAKKAIFLLGGKLVEKKEFLLPGSDLPRSLVMIKKVKGTPSKYPRKAGVPTKEPL